MKIIYILLASLFIIIFKKNYNEQSNYEYYAILTSTKNLKYLFPLPITALVWQEHHINSIVILVGSENEYNKNPKLKLIYDFLKEIKAEVHFISSPKVLEMTISQMVRLYAASLPFSTKYDTQKTIFITADADMLTFNASQHIPDHKNKKLIKLFNSKCCKDVKIPRAATKVHQIPMNTIAMPINLWREILEVDLIENGNALCDKLIEEFGGEKFFKGSKNRGSSLWYADQSLISYKLDKWFKQNISHKLLVEEYSEKPKRIDRPKWKTYNFNKIRIKDYDDSHLIDNIYLDANWEKVLPLFKIIFKDKPNKLKLIEDYKSNMSKFMKKA